MLMRQIILDTETTGLLTTEGHRIIEIGGIELIDRKFTGKRFHQYINPEREVEEGALAVHGITNQFLLDKPKFAEIMPAFVEFISGAELIIHNASFDVGFIDYEFRLVNKKSQAVSEICRIFDTLILARKLHIGQRNSLDALCKRYGVDNSHRDMHGALLDAHLLAQVYLAMTGGQGSLFDDLQKSETTTQEAQTVVAPILHARELRVLKASPEELALHLEYLQKMAKKSQCLWLEETKID